jgi:hypothetical protein
MVRARALLFAVLIGPTVAVSAGIAYSVAPIGVPFFVASSFASLCLGSILLGCMLRGATRAMTAACATLCYCAYLAAVPVVRGPWVWVSAEGLSHTLAYVASVLTLGIVALRPDGVHLNLPIWPILFVGGVLFWQGFSSAFARPGPATSAEGKSCGHTT